MAANMKGLMAVSGLPLGGRLREPRVPVMSCRHPLPAPPHAPLAMTRTASCGRHAHVIRRRRGPQLCRAAAEGVDAGLNAAAERLAEFCEALQNEDPEAPPGLSDDQLADLLTRVPGLVQEQPSDVRAKLDEVCAATGLTLGAAAHLFARVPSAWNRSAQALASRLEALAAAFEVSTPQAAALVAAVPPMFAVNTPSILRDRLDGLALRLGLPVATAVQLVVQQPVLWSVPPQHIQSGVPRLCERLGLSTAEAVDLVARVPVILSLEERLLQLQVGALSPVLGVPVPQLLELLGRCLGLVAVPSEVLGSNLTNLAAALDVKEEDALALLIRQPALLAAQLPTLGGALDALEGSLRLGSRATALRLLAEQPALLVDTTVAGISERLEALSALFQVSLPELRALVAQQPALLLVAPFTLRAALATAQASGQQASPQECLQLLVEDPGGFVSLATTEEQLDGWSARLGIPVEDVQQLLRNHPAIADMAPNTVKARLESLCALLGIPLSIAVQLVDRHPALASIPPNVVITRIKGLSLALGASMQTLGVLVAKAPGVLGCAVTAPGELNRDLKPHVDAVQEVVAMYEFYTMDWLQRGMKEAAPQRVRSFSTLDRR